MEVGERKLHFPYIGSGNMHPYPDKYYHMGRYCDIATQQRYPNVAGTKGCSLHPRKRDDCLTCNEKKVGREYPRPKSAPETFQIGERNIHYPVMGSNACFMFPDKYYKMGRYQEIAQTQRYEPTHNPYKEQSKETIKPSVTKEPPQGRQEFPIPMPRLKPHEGDTFCIGERDIFFPFIGGNGAAPYPDKYFRLGRYQEMAAQNMCGKCVSPYKSPYEIPMAKKGPCDDPCQRPLHPRPPVPPVKSTKPSVPCRQDANIDCITCAKFTPFNKDRPKTAVGVDRSRESNIVSGRLFGGPTMDDYKASQGMPTLADRFNFDGDTKLNMLWPDRAPPRIHPQKQMPTIQPSLVYRQPQLDFMDDYAVQL